MIKTKKWISSRIEVVYFANLVMTKLFKTKKQAYPNAFQYELREPDHFDYSDYLFSYSLNLIKVQSALQINFFLTQS